MDFAEASASKLFQSNHSKASDSKRLQTKLSDLIRPIAQSAVFNAGDKRKTTYQHLLFPKAYAGFTTVSL